jgi:hypothetical protein
VLIAALMQSGAHMNPAALVVAPIAGLKLTPTALVAALPNVVGASKRPLTWKKLPISKSL